MTSFLLIGPIAKDKIIKDNKESFSIGGAVYYQSLVFEEFNQNYNIITTLKNKDSYLLEEFPCKDRIIPIFKEKTIKFINHYYSKNPDDRIQYSNFANIPLLIEDIRDILNKIKFDYILLNPLIKTDFNNGFLKFIKKEYDAPIFLSLQGLLRKNKGNKVCLEDNNKIYEISKYVDTIFLDRFESKLINLNKIKSNEIVITAGSKEGTILYNNKKFKIKPYKIKEVINPTGAGDTFMASYIIKRINGYGIEDSADFAAKVSSLKIGKI